MTDGKVHEIQIARQLSLQPGTILVVDRAYIDYLWMHRLTETSVFFVTRMRADIRYKVIRKRQTPRRGVVLRDEEILIRSVTHGVVGLPAGSVGGCARLDGTPPGSSCRPRCSCRRWRMPMGGKSSFCF